MHQFSKSRLYTNSGKVDEKLEPTATLVKPAERE